MFNRSDHAPAEPGLYPAKRGPIAIGLSQNRRSWIARSLSRVLVVVIPAPYHIRGKLQQESRVPDENQDPGYKMVPPVEPGDDVWIPGRPRLKAGVARNDNPALQADYETILFFDDRTRLFCHDPNF